FTPRSSAGHSGSADLENPSAGTAARLGDFAANSTNVEPGCRSAAGVALPGPASAGTWSRFAVPGSSPAGTGRVDFGRMVDQRNEAPCEVLFIDQGRT